MPVKQVIDKLVDGLPTARKILKSTKQFRTQPTNAVTKKKVNVIENSTVNIVKLENNFDENVPKIREIKFSNSRLEVDSIDNSVNKIKEFKLNSYLDTNDAENNNINKVKNKFSDINLESRSIYQIVLELIQMVYVEQEKIVENMLNSFTKICQARYKITLNSVSIQNTKAEEVRVISKSVANMQLASSIFNGVGQIASGSFEMLAAGSSMYKNKQFNKAQANIRDVDNRINEVDNRINKIEEVKKDDATLITPDQLKAYKNKTDELIKEFNINRKSNSIEEFNKNYKDHMELLDNGNLVDSTLKEHYVALKDSYKNGFEEILRSEINKNEMEFQAMRGLSNDIHGFWNVTGGGFQYSAENLRSDSQYASEQISINRQKADMESSISQDLYNNIQKLFDEIIRSMIDSRSSLMQLIIQSTARTAS